MPELRRHPLDEVSDPVAAEAACDAEVIDRVAFDMRPGPTQAHSSAEEMSRETSLSYVLGTTARYIPVASPLNAERTRG